MKAVGDLVLSLVAIAALSTAADLLSAESEAGRGARLVVGLCAVASVLSMLAAILRVADALERTHAQRIARPVLRRSPGKLHIQLAGVADAAVERLAMASKADLFEQVFGLHVVIEENLKD